MIVAAVGNYTRSEVFLLIEEKTSTAPPARHPRAAFLTLFTIGLVVAVAPLVLAIDAPWVIAWADICPTLIVVATALKCIATTRRQRGRERTAWLFISLAYLSYVVAQFIWSTYELVLDHPNPIASLADLPYLIAPPLMMTGIWLYRTRTPTLSAAIVQIGNVGIIVATIYLANAIVFQHLLVTLEPARLSQTLIAYAGIATTAFLFALFNICFFMRGRRRFIMMPLLFALGSIALSDYLATYEIATNTYNSATYANIGYFVAFAFGYWAAFEQDHLDQFPSEEHDLQKFDEAARRWGTLLVPLAITGLIAVALTHSENLTAHLIPHATGALLVVSASVAMRDWWSRRIEVQLREVTRISAASLEESERRLLVNNEELAAANRKLSKEMAARKQIQEELRHSQKMEAIGQLTGGVAHDFNNLLAVIVGNVDLLEQTLELDSSQLVYTQEATAAANRGAALTERLLAFSRKQALAPRPTRAADLIESMRGLLERTLGENIRLRFEMNAGVASCMMDRAQFENAILNLVLNARDAMRGGGMITIEVSNVTLDVHDVAENPDAAAGDYVSIAVRDTGAGMSASVRERVFEPFFTTKDMGAGSGLGLSMVYGFARQSGGFISIESEVGSGTEARLYIPRTDLPPEPIKYLDTDSAPSGERESVLVVEDDPALRRVIVSFLENRNYQVTAAPNGADALAILDDRGPFDLLLSDVILPGEISGPELAAEINSKQPLMKILLMSGYASDALDGKTSLPKYANLLQKPFNMATLAREIRSVLKADD